MKKYIQENPSKFNTKKIVLKLTKVDLFVSKNCYFCVLECKKKVGSSKLFCNVKEMSHDSPGRLRRLRAQER